MDQFSGGGNWSMIPNVQAQGNFAIGSDSAAAPVFSFPFPSLSCKQQTKLSSFYGNHCVCVSNVCYWQLVEKLSDAVETGTRDQNSDALVSELNGHFDKCQQLLNSISGSLGSKTTMTVDGQKRNLEESEQLLQQRRDLIMEYRKSIEDLVKIEP
uniref:Mediator of RNA polymerase II transcription subunit 9 n=1 Tax=Brassica campestris TaxID=3711 RepID=M4EQ18_BRACM